MDAVLRRPTSFRIDLRERSFEDRPYGGDAEDAFGGGVGSSRRRGAGTVTLLQQYMSLSKTDGRERCADRVRFQLEFGADSRSLCLSIRDRLHQRHDGDSTDNKRQSGSHDRYAEYQLDYFEAGRILCDHGSGIPPREMRANSIGLETSREGRDAVQPTAHRAIFVLSSEFSKQSGRLETDKNLSDTSTDAVEKHRLQLQPEEMPESHGTGNRFRTTYHGPHLPQRRAASYAEQILQQQSYTYADHEFAAIV